MTRDDDRFGDDLREAFGRDLPDETFADAILDRVEGGRTQELSVPPLRGPRGLRWIVVGLAAALLIVAVLRLWPGAQTPEPAPGGGDGIAAAGPGEDDPPPLPGATLTAQEDDAEAEKDDEEAEEVLAEPARKPAGPIELPRAARTAAHPADLVIGIRADGLISIETRTEIRPDGSIHTRSETTDHAGLKRWLAAKAAAARGPDARPNEKSDLSVLIRADRRVGWRQVQWVMQACADPSVRIWKLQMATTVDGQGAGALPTPLPVDRGLGSGPLERPIEAKIVLRRFPDHPETTISWAGEGLGRGEDGLRRLRSRLDGAKAAAARNNLNLGAQIDAGATVPHAEIIRAIDLCMEAGIANITFVGAPPPPAKPVPPAPRVKKVVEKVFEEVRVTLAKRDGEVVAFLDTAEPLSLDELEKRLPRRLGDLEKRGVKVEIVLDTARDIPPESTTRVVRMIGPRTVEVRVSTK